MLPLSLLKAAQGHPMLVELKNGETYNGHLNTIDSWMNLMLRDVICTSKDGTKFWKVPEIYIRGNTIKYLRIPEEIIDVVQENILKRDHNKDGRDASDHPSGGAPEGGRGGRGRGGGRGGGDRGRGRGRGRGGGGGRNDDRGYRQNYDH